MKILDKDLLEINNLYSRFIEILSTDFRSNSDGSVQNALSFISGVYNNFINKKRDICPSIDNISSLGVYSLYGFQVCRTTNSMLFDFMKKVGFDVILKTILIDENEDWSVVEAIHANHMVVSMKSLKKSKYFDLFNGLFFEKESGEIRSIEIDEIKPKIDYSQYEVIINRISEILDKYLLLEKLGIEKVYSYE